MRMEQGLKRICVSILALCSPYVVASAPPLPAPIVPYMHEASFDPGDYGWLRGAFADASEADARDYRLVLEWRSRCRSDDLARTRASLAAIGVTAGKSLDTMPYPTLACSQVATLPETMNDRDWASFSRDVEVVRPLYRTFMSAVTIAEKSVLTEGMDLRDELNARVVAEQMLRSGIDWVDEASDLAGPQRNLTEQQRSILQAELGIALKVRDHANAAWLKGVVAERGWPRISQVGGKAARSAWLLAQHADADPVFQVLALRSMETLVSAGEVDARSFAYLHDRVMLKVVGRQRYGTQLVCNGAKLEAMPLEDAASVDQYRRGVGLGSMSEAFARRAKMAGPCR